LHKNSTQNPNINGVHWLHTHAPKEYPALTENIEVDVVVVGAGLCGSSTAWHLSQSGLRVALVEARDIAHGATGRNAGFILQGTAERYNRAIVQMGREKARTIHHLSVKNHRKMREWIQHHNADCEYKQGGSLQLASSPEEEAELIESADLLLEDGFEAQLLYGEELGEPYLSAGFQTGIVLPEDGEIHPVKFVQEVVRKAYEHGVQVFTNSPVTSIESDEEVRLTTPNGTITAHMAVLCTNAYLPQLFKHYENIIHPVRGQMLCTTPQPPIFERPIYADHGFDYWRQKSDGRIVLGGWRNLDPDAEVGYAETLHPSIQESMTRFLQGFKGLEAVEIESRWSGIMGFSRDGLPLIGGVPGQDNLMIGAGFTGHGFGFAWLAGHSLATMILDSEDELAKLCTPRRFD
jgi:gamma-glutamylputrescine oxidase